ncbi:MAG: hypothetical protein A3H50_00085 [Candidatus Levybacteria bacterium RIFCSPLOWO2_02_FULL_37_10]|nr:MAG: hypothetical protein A2860_01520 [Candidatus Levybacteria bacterium RIFCSPHIGHO2_01_FULL_37_33]OGH17626.1 MAG: hypothetical protein A3C97_02445 [Candidatus Levybacteria bacterium RIFCSPHIGHO2_02_FULL_37_11]OGH29332.1 MAG: hypothetical protein A3F30_02240 [Candidatus Levybacteria bacterium RIFCSPHIGHO2_12_FULL_37_12]OGH32454.1 MAG: hypothetical protein A2953_01695 [Candidatus Levybacteria bacterium RIFCSPLOWO2_01_FULL_36_54]OGH43263.1 MAG: hypothetical protein A3H50_00085 [Candidatus Lev
MIYHKSSIINRKSQLAFTLIELLIVIVIIGVLATIFFANYLGVRQRANDSKRKSDLRQIQAALELIRSDTGSYPASLYSANCPTSSPLQVGAVIYMNKIPCDPPPSMGNPLYFPGDSSGRNYFYNLSSGTTYYLFTCIENTNDKGPNVITQETLCTTGKGYYLPNP